MTLTAETQPFAVLGHPIRHSLSPAMHNAAFKALGRDAVYLAFDVVPDRLLHTLHLMAELGFGGLNLTVPLKEAAFRGIHQLDRTAQVLGSVNTVKIVDRKLEGFSTDGDGFLMAIKEDFDVSVEGLGVLVLGCGGAGRAVAIACALAGAGRLWLANREFGRARRLEAEIKGLKPGLRVETAPSEPAAWTRAARDADLIVQATSQGMKTSDPPLLGPDAFRPGQWLYDLIYMFPETAQMKAARAGGAQAANGLDMLLYQGVLSFSIWTGVNPPVEVMRRVLKKAVYD